MCTGDVWQGVPCVARLNQPLPAQALDPAWQPHLLQTLRALTFSRKIDVLAAAASSGSEVNLELTWGLLRPYFADRPPYTDDNVAPAAVRHGHLHLLPWMLQHRCPLSVQETLEAAAEHCDLAGLQRVWGLLGGTSRPPDGFWPSLMFGPVRGASRSAVDSLRKLAWLLLAVRDDRLHQDRQVLWAAAAEGAAACGNMPALRLLLALGMDLPSVVKDQYLHRPAHVAPWCQVLAGALRHGHVAVADWLVDEAGCPLPPEQEQLQQQGALRAGIGEVWRAAAEFGGAKVVHWLLRRGVPVHEAAISAAVGAGRLEAVQFLHEACALELTKEVFSAAVYSRSMPTVTWLLQAGCPLAPDSCGCAAGAGDVGMVRWLVQEVGCHWGQDTLTRLIKSWRWRGMGSCDDLAQTIRALVEAGCPPHICTSTMDVAACAGCLPLLRYLHQERGVGFGPETLSMAVEGGSEVVVEWLVARGCAPGPGAECDPYVSAGRCGDTPMLACLRRLGVPWNERVVRWAAEEPDLHLHMLRWLVEHGAPWDEAAMVKAIRGAGSWDADTVAWLAARLGRDR